MSFVPNKKRNSSSKVAGAFIAVGGFLLAYAFLFEMQIAAFIGLGMVFWGAIFAVTRSGKYVESSLLDGGAKATYSTLDRIMNDLKYNGKGYYIPAYAQDVVLPDYLKNLKEPVVYISETFDGKPSVDELAAAKFLSAKTNGVFVASPGAGVMAQIEKQLQMDITKINLQELCEVMPKCLTEIFNLAKNAELTVTGNEVSFKATGILFESLYKPENKLKSVSILGCPVVSAVASALAKSSGKTVLIREQTLLSANCGVHAVFNFV